MEILYLAKQILVELRVLYYRKKIYFSLSKLNKLVIVTASDKSHEKSLLQLLISIEQFEPNATIMVYDLGLSSKTKNYMEMRLPNLDMQVIKIDFNQYPNWMNISNKSKGEYAWKPLVIRATAKKILHQEKRSKTTLLWLDAGDKLTQNLRTIRRYIQCYAFWSPASDGKIKDWTHEGLLLRFNLNKKQLNSNNLNGAIIGFSLDSNKSLILLEKWTDLSMQKDFIAPKGSDRTNHRQDQALLTVLAYKYSLQPREVKILTYPNKSGILIHSDIDFLSHI